MRSSIRQRHQAQARARIARLPKARVLLTFLALFAFTVQSYVTQTHIHIAGHAGVTAFFDLVQIEPAAKAVAADQTAAPHGKVPLNADPADCPLCQQSALAGHFVVPTALLLVLPSYAAFNVVVFTETIRVFSAPSHNWQGRAPPIA